MTNDLQSAPERASGLRFLAGLLCLAISLCASAALVAKHLHLFQAPGCGAGSACDQAAASVFGSVPLVGWPLSHFGVAWFTVLLVTWTASFRGSAVSNLFRVVVRLSAAGSLVYVGAMLVGGYLCPYCLAVHVGNFAFLFVEAGAPRTNGPPLAFAGRGAAVFALVTGALVGAEAWQARSAEQERQQSTQEIIDAMGAAPVGGGAAFIGRYPHGPERAPIRIVSFVDYSCAYCKKIEEQAQRISATRDDVQVSLKHFPLCSDCNRHAVGSPHPDACRAAIAAETAGMLGGGEAFRTFSQWLFDRNGVYADADLRAFVRKSGLDEEEFFEALNSEEPQRRVEADADEANRLGIFGTPVVYINGVELKGFHTNEGLLRAVEDLAAAGLPARDASADQPMGANERHISAWRADAGYDIRPSENGWSLGQTEASDESARVIEIVLFGDYLIPATAEADALVRELVGRASDVSYAFRHFPISVGCNPVSKRTINEWSCLAHVAAEAAGRLNGEAGFWGMHDWILANQEGLTMQALDAAAVELGFEAAAFRKALGDPANGQAIESDCRESARVRSFGSPSIVIDGRKVPNWMQPGILELLVDEARTNPLPRQNLDDHAAHFHASPAQKTRIAGGMAVGPENAAAEIVLWGDLQSPETVLADRTLQEVFGRRDDVRYRFRHFPVDSSCNPNVDIALNREQPCLASRALEAASKTKGIVGYWRMHAWLMGHQEGLNRNALIGAASTLKLDRKVFRGWLDHADVQAVIDNDLLAASELGVSDAPTVFLNDRRVPNWDVDGLLDRLIDQVVNGDLVSDEEVSEEGL